jgi:hypothetical protein
MEQAHEVRKVWSWNQGENLIRTKEFQSLPVVQAHANSFNEGVCHALCCLLGRFLAEKHYMPDLTHWLRICNDNHHWIAKTQQEHEESRNDKEKVIETRGIHLGRKMREEITFNTKTLHEKMAVKGFLSVRSYRFGDMMAHATMLARWNKCLWMFDPNQGIFCGAHNFYSLNCFKRVLQTFDYHVFNKSVHKALGAHLWRKKIQYKGCFNGEDEDLRNKCKKYQLREHKFIHELQGEFGDGASKDQIYNYYDNTYGIYEKPVFPNKWFCQEANKWGGNELTGKDALENWKSYKDILN